jgi:hypothetical protein
MPTATRFKPTRLPRGAIAFKLPNLLKSCVILYNDFPVRLLFAGTKRIITGVWSPILTFFPDNFAAGA